MQIAYLRSRLLDGDISVMGEIFELYYKTLYSYAYHLLRNEEDARDAVQEVFVKICVKPESWGRITDFRSYLITSVRNQCILLLRKRNSSEHNVSEYQAYQHAISSNTDSPKAYEEITKHHDESLVEKILSNFPKKRRAVIRLFYMEDLSYNEISERLGITKDTVKTQLRLARGSFFQLKHLLRITIILSSFLN